MILGSYERMAIGERRVRMVTDSFGNEHNDQPVLILREATRAEWVAYSQSVRGDRHDPSNGCCVDPAYFYEVSTD